MPFGVWVDALDAYVASQVARARRAGDAALLDELGTRPAVACRAATRHRRRRSPTSATAPTARSGVCSSGSPTRAPVVLVLDDLHWSDGASIELIAALLRRGPDAPVLLALAFRAGRAPGAPLGRAGRPRASSGIELGAAHRDRGRASCSADVDAAVARRDLQPRRRQPVLPRGARARQRAGRAGRRPRNPTAAPRARRRACRRPSPRRSPRSWRRSRRAARVACSTAPPSPASRSSPISRRRSPSCPTDRRLRRARRPARRSTSSAPPRCPRRFVFRHPLVRQAVYESTRGGWRLAAHARAAEALAARGAAAAERAHHVEQSASQGDEAAIELLLAAGERDRGRRARAPRRAGSRRRCGCCPPPTAHARPTCASRSPRALRSLGELERCRDAAARGARAAARRRRRAARRAHHAAAPPSSTGSGATTRPTQRLIRAWEDLPRPRHARGGGAPGRARRRRAPRVRLRADPRDGPRGARPRRRLGDRAADRRGGSGARARRGGRGADRRTRASTATRPWRRSTRLADAELAPRLEALYYLAWAENYLEHYDEAIAHAERGIADRPRARRGPAAGADDARQGLPVRDPGPPAARRSSSCEQRRRGGARSRRNPHYLFWALFELGWAHYYAGDLEAHHRRLRGERAASAAGWRAARCPPPAAGRAGRSPPRDFELGELERGLRDHGRARRRRPRARDPRRALLLLGDARARRAGARPARRGRGASRSAPRSTPRRSTSAAGWRSPAAPARRSCSPPATPPEAAVVGRARRPPAASGRRRRAPGRVRDAASRAGRSPPRATRTAAIAALREAEGVFDACGAAARCATRPGASCASSARAPRSAGPASGRGLRPRRAHEARARDRRPRHRPQDQPRDRRRALPQREDDRVPPAQHLREARRLLARRGRARRRARPAHARRAGRDRRDRATGTAARDADAARLHELGYEQELDRGLGIFGNVAMGFAAISPVVGLYAVVFVGTAVAGPAWIWVLPVALAGQCLLLAVYAELASEFPIAGGAYQWSRRLIGGAYGWFTGWVAICAYAVANTTIAYLGAPWALTLLGDRAHAARDRRHRDGLRRRLRARRRGRHRRARARRQGRDRRRDRRLGRHRARAAARLPRAGLLDLHRDARRRGAVGRLGRRRDARRARGRRLGVHRLRRLRRRCRGDAATPPATCRGRSGSRCSASARS